MKNRKPKADGSYLVPVNFTAKEVDLLSHADMQGNFSAYIKGLIKKDMNPQPQQQNITLEAMMGMFSAMMNKTVQQERAVEVQEETPKGEVNKDSMNKFLSKRNRSK